MLSDEYFEFFTLLEQHNTKEWFAANKSKYERFVKKPFHDLVAGIIEEMQTVDPGFTATPQSAIFRIYRDIRFSKDKTPYKTHMAAHITQGAKAETGPPGLYFEVHATGGSIGGGIYEPSRDQLVLVRDLIMHEGKSLHKLLKAQSFRKYYPDGLVGEKHKILPAEFKEAAKSEPLLYHKQLLWWANVPTSMFMQPQAAKSIAAYYKAAKPVSDFFSQAFA